MLNENKELNNRKDESSFKEKPDEEIDILSLPSRSVVHKKKHKNMGNYPLIRFMLVSFILLIAVFFTFPSWVGLVNELPVDLEQPSINPAVEVVKKVKNN